MKTKHSTKKLRKWLGVCAAIVAIIIPVIAIIASLNSASAATGEDLKRAKQNAFYKVVYANLDKCFGAMKSPIEQTMTNTWAAFDSDTYFSSEARQSTFLKFPYGVTNNQSSCPAMITGWKTNWFVNLFTGTGSYSGLLSLNSAAEVPGNDWYSSDTTKMANFLKSIGYQENSEADGTMGDRKCFYIKFALNSSTYDNNWLPRPKSGEYFETNDYCAKLDNNNKVVMTNDAIVMLKGTTSMWTNDYDSGHLTDASNAAYFEFTNASDYVPGFVTGEGSGWSGAGATFLDANLGQILLRYNSATNYEAQSLWPQSIDSKDHATSTQYCAGLGYSWCGWGDNGIFSSTKYYGSISSENDTITFANLKQRLKGIVDSAKDRNGYDLFSNVSVKDYSPASKSYAKKSNGAADFKNYFIGSTSSYNNGVLNDAEKYMLYYTLLNQNYNTATSDTAVGSDSVQVSWATCSGDSCDGTFKKLYIYEPSASTTKSYVLNGSSKWDGTTQQDWKWIAQQLAAINVETAFNAAVEDILDPTLEPENPAESGESADSWVSVCLTNANSLGWILCPVLEFASGAVETLYESVVAPFLEIKAELLSTSEGGNSLYTGWKQFRDIANIGFAIAFIVVILSQLTGVGLSNYNIKKTLPRLIMVVVLVNLSYLICQIAVDISNILGSQLYTLFDGWAAGVNLNGNALGYTLGSFMGELVTTLFTATAAAGAIILAINTWEFWLLPLLLIILGCLIGIFFFFIILGVRQAGVIILVVLSPLAIVCYALPNTKSLFDKWKKMFISLLMAYPICGALMGGSQFASALLIGAANPGESGFFYVLVAMLLSVVPFFLIPGIVRKSVDGIAGLGTKISGFGQRLSRWGQSTIRNSGTFREGQRMLAMNNDRRLVNRLNRREEGRGRLGVIDQRRRAAAASRYRHAALDNAHADAETGELPLPGTREYDALTAGARRRVDDERVRDYRTLYDTDAIHDSDGSGNMVNRNDLEAGGSVEREYNHLLDRLDIDQHDTEANARIRALQGYLSEQGDAGEELIQRVFANRIASGQRATAIDDHGVATYGARLNNNDISGLSIASGYIKSNGAFMKDIKNKDKGLFRMVNDFNSQQYERAQEYATRTGTPITAGEYYAMQGASGYSSETLAGANDHALERLATSVREGRITGDTLDRLMEAADGAITNAEHLNLKGDAKTRIQDILNAGYSQGARRFDRLNTAPTAGSSALRRADAKSLDGMARTIAGSNGGHNFNPADYATFTADQRAEYDMAQAAAENARLALLDPDANYTSEQVSALQSIITAARNKGVLQMDASSTGPGTGDFETVDPVYIRTREGGTPTRSRIVEARARDYSSGHLQAYRRGGGTSHAVNVNDYDASHADSIINEHGSLLTNLASATDDADREEIQTRLSAIQGIMAKTTEGQDAMYNNFQAASTSGIANINSALQFAGQHLASSPHMSRIEASDTGLGEMIHDLNGGHPIAGRSYNVRAAQAATADSLATMSRESSVRMSDAIRSHEVIGNDLNALTRSVGLAMQTHSSSLSSDSRAQLQDVAASAIEQGTGRVVQTFAHTGDAATDDMVQWIQTHASDATFHPRIQAMGQNLAAAYRASGNTEAAQANIGRMLQTISDAGITDASGASFNPAYIRPGGGSATRVIEATARDYSSGSINSITGGAPVVVTDFDTGAGHENSITNEHGALLAQLAAATTDAEREQAEVRLSAVQGIMARSADGQDAMFQNFEAASRSGMANIEDALQFAGQHLASSPHMTRIEASDSGLGEMIRDLDGGRVISGENYRIRGAQAATADNLATMSRASSARMADAIQSSDITGNDLNNLTRSLGLALHNHSSKLNAAAHRNLQNVAAAAIERDTNDGHAGRAAQTFAHTGSEATSSMVQWIQANAADASVQPRIETIGRNLAAAFHSTGNTADAQNNLRSMLKAISDAGITDTASGHSFDPDDPNFVPGP